MPVPGPYDKEPTVEIPGGLWKSYIEARDNAAGWKKQEDYFRGQIEKVIGDNPAGTVGGIKVVSWRPTDRYSEKRIQQEYPEIAAHFVVTETVERFDMSAFLAQHGDLAEPFRSRQFRMVGDE